LRVLVSGAAAGVGLACAELLAEAGVELMLVDCDGVGLTRTARRLGARSLFCDAIGSANVDVFAQELAKTVPAIDILINAAGRGFIRALAVTRVSSAVLPLLRSGSGPRLVINIASAGGFEANEQGAPYASAQESFEQVSEALKMQVRGTGIEVVSLYPSLSSNGGSNAMWSDEIYALQRADDRETASRVLGLIDAARPEWRQRRPWLSRRARPS